MKLEAIALKLEVLWFLCKSECCLCNDLRSTEGYCRKNSACTVKDVCIRYGKIVFVVL